VRERLPQSHGARDEVPIEEDDLIDEGLGQAGMTNV